MGESSSDDNWGRSWGSWELLYELLGESGTSIGGVGGGRGRLEPGGT